MFLGHNRFCHLCHDRQPDPSRRVCRLDRDSHRSPCSHRLPPNSTFSTSSQRGLSEITLRSWCARSSLSLELKTGSAKTDAGQPSRGRCLVLFTRLLKCSPALTCLPQSAPPLALLLPFQSAWNVLHPNPHMAYLSLPVICFSVINTSVLPSPATLQKQSKRPSPQLTFALALFLRGVWPHLKRIFIYMSPALPYTIIKGGFCLRCLLLDHL